MIERSQFEAYSACILSGQIDHREVSRLLADNPEFDTWYRSIRNLPAAPSPGKSLPLECNQ